MKKQHSPNSPITQGQQIFIPLFVYPDDSPLPDGPFEGYTRGYSPQFDDTKRYEATIGIYTDTGVYHTIKIDTRVECATPTFFIDDEPYFYPIVAFYTMGGGLPMIDPATGYLKD